MLCPVAFLEREAQAAHRGLWADKAPVPPVGMAHDREGPQADAGDGWAVVAVPGNRGGGRLPWAPQR